MLICIHTSAIQSCLADIPGDLRDSFDSSIEKVPARLDKGLSIESAPVLIISISVCNSIYLDGRGPVVYGTPSCSLFDCSKVASLYGQEYCGTVLKCMFTVGAPELEHGQTQHGQRGPPLHCCKVFRCIIGDCNSKGGATHMGHRIRRLTS